MANTEYFVQIPNSLLGKYDNKVLLLVGIIGKYRMITGKYFLQLEFIYESLGINKTNPYRRLIRNLLSKLQDDGYIIYDGDIDKLNYHKAIFVDIPTTDSFTQIPHDAIDTILAYDGNESKFNLFAVYFTIKRHLFNENTSWVIPYDKIKKLTGIKHNQTIQNLVTILENLGLITKTEGYTKANNNHQRPCFSFSVVSQKEKNTIEPPRQQQPPRQQSTAENNNPSFSVVSKKEKEKKSSFSNKETTTAKEGRVLTEGDKNISPPTPPTQPKDISPKVWEAWMELPEVLRRGKSLEYCEEDGKYYVIQTLDGVKTRYLFAVPDDKYDDDDDLPL